MKLILDCLLGIGLGYIFVAGLKIVVIASYIDSRITGEQETDLLLTVLGSLMMVGSVSGALWVIWQ